MRFVPSVLLVLLLAACAGTNQGTGTTTRVLGNTLTLAPPRGYCPDPSASRSGPSDAFVLYGTCKGLSQSGPRAPAAAVLTAAAASTGGIPLDTAEGISALAEFLTTDAGKTALSRSDDGSQVSILSIQNTSDLILVRARDGAMGDLAPEYHRAIFTTSGALVTVTVSGTRAAPLPQPDGQALIIDFVAAIRAANGPNSGEPQDDPQPAPNALAGFFKRLL